MEPGGGASAGASPPRTTGTEALALPVVLAAGPGSADRAYLDGMQVGIRRVNATGGIGGVPLRLVVHEHGGDPGEAERVLREVVSTRPAALLYAGPGSVVSSLRPELQDPGTPLVLLEGDLYTPRALFREVFQVSIPWEWQAQVVARYLVLDRRAKDVVYLGAGPEAAGAERALRGAMAYWGGGVNAAFVLPGLGPQGDPPAAWGAALDRASRADWAVAFGPAAEARGLAEALDRASGPRRPGIAGPAALLGWEGASASPGTVAVHTYTWAGWAQPIARVNAFRSLSGRTVGRTPSGLEQEGYDAVRALAEGLRATGGLGGPALVAALEDLGSRAYAGFPVEFGPDDHLFPPRDELGLYATAGPREALDPWMDPEEDRWRALMRTFTYDGERTNVLDRDRKVFFPFWDPGQPGPPYWRSRYGIVSGPEDPLH